MIAIIKNNKKILLSQIDISERALIDDFVRKATKQEIKITKLFDIDNELDGVNFGLNGKKHKIIDFKTPCIQVVAVKCSTLLDLEVDEQTNVSVDYADVSNYLEVRVINKKVRIRAKSKEELDGTTVQYIFNVILSKPDFDTVILPINVSVLYIENSLSGDYEKLDNLPKIDNVTLKGNKKLDDLGIQAEMDALNNSDIDDIFN